MKRSSLASKYTALWAAAGVLGLIAIAAVSTTAQTPANNLRTPWGTPNLQGTWFVLEDVPLERPARWEGREFLTPEEIAALDADKGVDPGRNSRAGKSEQDVSGAYNAVFNSVLRTGKRTSRIIDPADGRIPTNQAKGKAGGAGAAKGAAPGAAKGAGAGAAKGGAGAAKGGGPGAAKGGGAGVGGPLGTLANQVSDPETAAQSPRCLGVQMPFLPLNTLFAQGTVMQIVQSPTAVTIYMEDDHAGGGNRVVYMSGSHPSPDLKFYLGDSRGRWDGNTLVVETTNFQTGFRGSNPATYKLTERFTRLGTNDLRREITFEDPQTWPRPWTVQIDMGKTDDGKHMIFDSACHEGNYGMTGLLVGARREEQASKAGNGKQ